MGMKRNHDGSIQIPPELLETARKELDLPPRPSREPHMIREGGGCLGTILLLIAILTIIHFILSPP